MCSGCSGDYTGGFEDTGELGSDPDEDCFAAWRLPAERSRPREHHAPGFTGANGMFTPHTTVARIGEDTRRQSWEVLVSATQIVEVHSFEAPRDEDGKRGAREMAEIAEAGDSPRRAVPNIIGRGGRAEGMNQSPEISCAQRERSPRGRWRKAFAVPGVKRLFRGIWAAIRTQP